MMASLLARRGVLVPDDVEDFLEPSRAAFHDPFLLHGMGRAVERLRDSQRSAERVAIVGDYDVDGVSGTALLTAVLRACKIEVEPLLPNRLRDGYGFQPTQVHKAEKLGCGLIVTVDCGTTSTAAVLEARRLGIDVVITDHHLPSPDLPPDTIQINPHQEACSYPFDELSGAGLAFKLATAVMTASGREPPLDRLLRVACLGTIADLVPLRGENRAIAALGLKALEETRSVGLRALIDVARVRPPFQASDVGFKLGPRLNAAGRMRQPDEALELLLTRDRERARELARLLDECNEERRETEHRIVDEARRQVEARPTLAGILVHWSADWHRGVVGIAASRIAREFHRPTLLFALEGDSATGSGRSIPGVGLHAFLSSWPQRYERFGGHPQAVGMTVRSSALEALRELWESAAQWPDDVLVRSVEYELELQVQEVSRPLLEELDRLRPHGQKNRQPLIRVGPLSLAGAARVFGNGHVKGRARGSDGAEVALLAWSFEDRMALLDEPFEILAHLEWDRFDQQPVLEARELRAVDPLAAS